MAIHGDGGDKSDRPKFRRMHGIHVPESMVGKKRAYPQNDPQNQLRFVLGLFREAFASATKLMYNAAWYDPASNSLARIRHDPVVMAVSGSVLASQDAFGRRIIMFPTRYGIVVAYDAWPLGDSRHRLIFNAFLNEKGLKKSGTAESGEFYVNQPWLVDVMKDLKELVFNAPAPAQPEPEAALNQSIKELIEPTIAASAASQPKEENIMNETNNTNTETTTEETVAAKPSFWARIKTAFANGFSKIAAFFLAAWIMIRDSVKAVVTAVKNGVVGAYTIVKNGVVATGAWITSRVQGFITWAKGPKKAESETGPAAGAEPAAA
jgi:hypothetical protein